MDRVHEHCAASRGSRGNRHGFAALFGLAIQRYMEQHREDRRDRRERMAPIYEQLVRTFYGAADGRGNQDDLLTFFQDLAQSLLV